MSENRIRLRQCIIFILPFLFGTGGLLLAQESLRDAMFSSVCMYLLNYGDGAPNLYVEIARWSAPVMTASGILFALSSLRARLRNYLIYLRGGSVAVYGEPEETAGVLEELGSRGIAGGGSFVRAERYILLGDEESNFSFCRVNRAKLEGRQVSLKCSSLRAQTAVGGDLKLFSPYETAARLFWKRSGLSGVCGQDESVFTIVIIGFNQLGEELLTWGLLDNIFSPSQKLCYHVFGDGSEFLHTHYALDAITDRICFHDEAWHAAVPLLMEADRILLCGQDGQTALLRDLLFALPGKVIDVFPAADTPLDFFEEQERLRVFDWEREAGKLSALLADDLIELAKRINLRYAHLYNQVEETETNKNAEWKKLDSFTRYSNISSADYHEIRLQMLARERIPADYAKLTAEQLELLAELEHIRWCRYHYLNNWKYGVPADGAAKDKKLRIHKDLIPYDQLTDAEKQKDRDTIETLMAVDAGGL